MYDEVLYNDPGQDTYFRVSTRTCTLPCKLGYSFPLVTISVPLLEETAPVKNYPPDVVILSS